MHWYNHFRSIRWKNVLQRQRILGPYLGKQCYTDSLLRRCLCLYPTYLGNLNTYMVHSVPLISVDHMLKWLETVFWTGIGADEVSCMSSWLLSEPVNLSLKALSCKLLSRNRFMLLRRTFTDFKVACENLDVHLPGKAYIIAYINKDR